MTRRVSVAGRTCLITGGARGMGRLWAGHFAADGARLVLWDLDARELEKAAGEISAAGVEVRTAVVDVTDRAKVHEAAETLLREVDCVDILVNNAGVVFGGPFLEMPEEKMARTIEVNLLSMVWMHKAFLPAMVAKGEGHVINVASASGLIGVPYMPAYAASKWGVIGWTDSVRLEMELAGHRGLRFTVFCPSYVDTGMFEGVKAPLLVPLLRPEEAVRRGYRAFREGQYVIMEPLMVKITPALRALLPTRMFDAVSGILGVTTSMKKWKGRG